MKGDIDPGHRTRAHVDLTEIAAQKLDITRDAGEIGFIPRAEIGHDPNVVSQSNQPGGEMRADEAGTSRHEAL
jgi:hypothetical protein